MLTYSTPACIIMKHFQLICVLSVIAVAHAGGPDAKEKALIEECIKQTNASPADVKTFEDEIMPSTRIGMCLTACYYKKTGVVDNQNNINMDKVLEELEDIKKENKDVYEKLTKVLKDCHKNYTPIQDECDSLKSYFECVMKSSKEAGIPLEK